ncbi:alpha/beta hydrolase family protein [Spirosoma validum]|uniref:Alpha/beta hydrolase n=1 Tax=Spirosoma validum TaxID=2771355 RepID=A0A927GHB0_9BACT|nr:acyl-CoA thioester hydrolase/BAAT C-terminal domain-containing protein [Spirosoma validum]MBD2757751.1 hypothetical protein [Spirosoma validum]
MRGTLVILVSVFVRIAFAQHPNELLFEHYQLQTASLGKLSIHVTKTLGAKKQKPLLLYLDGSGNMPIFYKRRPNRYFTSVPLDIKRYVDDYHVVLISKPGVPFSDSLHYAQTGQEYYPTNAEYESRYSLDWRAQSASQVIDWLLKKLPVDRSQVIVLGYSEGSQVAPRVAVLNKKVTHVVCFVGNALNQFYDFLLTTRLQVEKSELTPEQGQTIIDSLYTQYAAIYQSPTDTKRYWYGATYQKWASFCTTLPLESMIRLSIPILYIAGGRDHNQTILDMDYAKLEFIRRGKDNLTYKVYPYCDHYLQEERIVEGKLAKKDRLNEAHQFALDWVKPLKR